MTANEEEKPKARPQQYQQDWSKKFGNYDSAKAAFREILNGTRRRIRRRADGSFDLVVYKQIEKVDIIDHGTEA